MKETQLSSRLVEQMKERGYFARKLSDAFTRGLPDVLFSRRGGTGFVEVKYLRSSFIPHSFVPPRKIIDAVQLATAVELETKSAYCAYLIFFNTSTVAAVRPRDIEARLEIELETMEVDQWMSKLPF